MSNDLNPSQSEKYVDYIPTPCLDKESDDIFKTSEFQPDYEVDLKWIKSKQPFGYINKKMLLVVTRMPFVFKEELKLTLQFDRYKGKSDNLKDCAFDWFLSIDCPNEPILYMKKVEDIISQQETYSGPLNKWPSISPFLYIVNYNTLDSTTRFQTASFETAFFRLLHLREKALNPARQRVASR